MVNDKPPSTYGSPLVTVYITTSGMENHHFEWENSLFRLGLYGHFQQQTVSLPEGRFH